MGCKIRQLSTPCMKELLKQRLHNSSNSSSRLWVTLGEMSGCKRSRGCRPNNISAGESPVVVCGVSRYWNRNLASLASRSPVVFKGHVSDMQDLYPSMTLFRQRSPESRLFWAFPTWIWCPREQAHLLTKWQSTESIGICLRNTRQYDNCRHIKSTPTVVFLMKPSVVQGVSHWRDTAVIYDRSISWSFCPQGTDGTF